MDIDKIIADYLSGEISSKDQKKLEHWLEEDTSHREQFESLLEIWKSQLGYQHIINIDDERKKIWNKLSNTLPHSNPLRQKASVFKNVFFRYAAIILLLLAVDYAFWKTFEPEKKPPVAVEKIERNNPLGQKSKIQLPDGSTVWLNAGSKLTYSKNFNNGTRKLYLEGEAFFEVAKNHAVPFEVFTPNLIVTAVGTSFNINAFKNKAIEKVALNTGVVKIVCIDSAGNRCLPNFLNPGELALFNNQTKKIDISDFEGTDPFGWKEGRLVFNHATFEEVLEILSRWYNVEFSVNGKLAQEWNYSATFENEVLENILESLKFSEKIDYKIEGSSVQIKV